MEAQWSPDSTMQFWVTQPFQIILPIIYGIQRLWLPKSIPRVTDLITVVLCITFKKCILSKISLAYMGPPLNPSSKQILALWGMTSLVCLITLGFPPSPTSSRSRVCSYQFWVSGGFYLWAFSPVASGLVWLVRRVSNPWGVGFKGRRRERREPFFLASALIWG